MSASRVREIRTHGLTGGRWRSDTNLTEKGEKAEAQHPTSARVDQPAAYLTATPLPRLASLARDRWPLRGSRVERSVTIWPYRRRPCQTSSRGDTGICW